MIICPGLCTSLNASIALYRSGQHRKRPITITAFPDEPPAGADPLGRSWSERGSWSRSLRPQVGQFDDLVREVLEAVLYIRRCPAEGQCPGVEACPVRAYGDGSGRSVTVALTVDQHAGGDVEGPGVGENLVVVGVPGIAVCGDLVLGVGDVHGVP